MNKMRNVFFVVLLMVGVFLVCAGEKIKFFPNGNSNSGSAIELSFNGKIYDKNHIFEYIKQRIKNSRAEPVEQVLYEFYESNLKGDKKRIIELWDDKDKENIRKMLEQKASYDATKAFYSNIISSKLVAVIYYGNYYICYVTHDIKGTGSYTKVYPMIKKSKGLPKMSNGLSHDFFFSKFSYEIGSYIYERHQ